MKGPLVTMFAGSVQFVAELLDRRLVHRQERVVRGLPDEPGLLRGQLDLERVVVDGGDADLVGERVAVVLAYSRCTRPRP